MKKILLAMLATLAILVQSFVTPVLGKWYIDTFEISHNGLLLPILTITFVWCGQIAGLLLLWKKALKKEQI